MGTELCCLALELEKAHETGRICSPDSSGYKKYMKSSPAKDTTNLLHEARCVESEGWGLWG